jgi:SAM-dependent methyltransferase
MYRLLFNSFSTSFLGRYMYPIVTRFGNDDLVFLNWGYEEDPPMAIPLSAADEPNRACIQLYHHTAAQTDLRGKRVLEVSCGHGGGAAYLARTVEPTSYTGLDLNETGITFCRKRHRAANLDFVHGDAMNLPFDTESFDAVVNIEAGHHYPQFRRFLAEVTRVLRPGGHFLYTDLCRREDIPEWEAALADVELRMASAEVINTQVLRGLKLNSQRSLDLISRHHLPAFAHGVRREFAGAPGSALYDVLQSGAMTYRTYHFVKD